MNEWWSADSDSAAQLHTTGTERWSSSLAIRRSLVISWAIISSGAFGAEAQGGNGGEEGEVASVGHS